MSDDQIEKPDAVVLGGDGAAPEAGADGEQREMISEPAKVMRIGSMVKQLLEEVKAAPLDDASRERLAGINERTIAELSTALSPDLQDELRSMAPPFRDGERPSDGTGQRGQQEAAAVHHSIT